MFVEGAILRHNRAFKGSNGLCDVLQARPSAKHEMKLFVVFGNLRDLRYDGVVLLCHFNGIVYGADRLFLQRPCSSIPKLQRDEPRIVDGGRLPPAGRTERSNRNLASICESSSGIVAKG